MPKGNTKTKCETPKEGCQREIPKRNTGNAKGRPAERQRNTKGRCQREILKGDARGRSQTETPDRPQRNARGDARGNARGTPSDRLAVYIVPRLKRKSNKGYQRNATGTLEDTRGRPEEPYRNVRGTGRQARGTPGQRDAKGPSKEPQRKGIQWDA